MEHYQEPKEQPVVIDAEELRRVKMVEDKEGLLLTDEEIEQTIGKKTTERYLARHCTDAEAKAIAKAQRQKILDAGYKSTEEVDDAIQNALAEWKKGKQDIDKYYEAKIKEAKKRAYKKGFKDGKAYEFSKNINSPDDFDIPVE